MEESGRAHEPDLHHIAPSFEIHFELEVDREEGRDTCDLAHSYFVGINGLRAEESELQVRGVRLFREAHIFSEGNIDVKSAIYVDASGIGRHYIDTLIRCGSIAVQTNVASFDNAVPAAAVSIN